MSWSKVLWFLSDFHAALSQGFALAAGLVDEEWDESEGVAA